jgi:tRNA G18 (ribose-2'-O)-methylase SpoU
MSTPQNSLKRSHISTLSTDEENTQMSVENTESKKRLRLDDSGQERGTSDDTMTLSLTQSTVTAQGPISDTKIEHECRLLIYNIGKKPNVGTLLRSAVAFGVREVVYISSRGRAKDLGTFGNKGTKNYVKITTFKSLNEAVEYLRNDGFRILGVEIRDDAKKVQDNPFWPRTAIVLGNEGDGLNAQIAAECDGFVYIPHYGHGTASLNVAVAGSIILQYYSSWAALAETRRSGEKFVVDETHKVNWKYIQAARARKAAESDARAADAGATDVGATDAGAADGTTITATVAEAEI